MMAFDIVKFREYLEANQERQFHTNSACDCPVAMWLRDTRKLSRHQVSIFYGHSSVALERYPTPRWIDKFVTYFDALDISTFKRPETRSGKHALEDLLRVAACLQLDLGAK